MAKLTAKQVLHVAKLANLTLTKAEVAKFKNQLSSVLDYVDALAKVVTKDIYATNQTTGLQNMYREDEVDSTNVLPAGDVVSGTSKVHNDYFVVPQVIDDTKK